MKLSSCRCFVVLVAILLVASNLMAAPKAEGGAKERIAYIQNVLDDGKKNAQIWYGLWIAAYAGLAAGQFGLGTIAWNHNARWSMWNKMQDDFNISNKSTFPRKEQWVNYYVGGTKAALSCGLLIIQPFTPAFAAGRLAVMPEGTPEEMNKKLTAAERLLEQSAKKERMGRAWWKHLLGVAVNGAGSVIIWQCQKGKDPWKDALISFASGFTVFELTIWTQPMRAVKDWDNYKKKYKGGAGAYHEEDVDRWFITLCPGGLAAGVYF